MVLPSPGQLGRAQGSDAASQQRGWNLALAFQEVFTAIVRLKYNRQAVSNAEAFRAQMKQALRVAEQEARTQGYAAEDVRQVIFAVVAFLDEDCLIFLVVSRMGDLPDKFSIQSTHLKVGGNTT